MGSALSRLLLPALAALSLTSCERPAAPVAVAPALPPPVPSIQLSVAATWVFDAGEVCSATASNPALSLQVKASSSKLALIVRVGRGTAMPARAAVPIAFAGTSGSWAVPAHVAPSHQVIASQAMTDDKAGQDPCPAGRRHFNSWKPERRPAETAYSERRRGWKRLVRVRPATVVSIGSHSSIAASQTEIRAVPLTLR